MPTVSIEARAIFLKEDFSAEKGSCLIIYHDDRLEVFSKEEAKKLLGLHRAPKPALKPLPLGGTYLSHAKGGVMVLEVEGKRLKIPASQYTVLCQLLKFDAPVSSAQLGEATSPRLSELAQKGFVSAQKTEGRSFLYTLTNDGRAVALQAQPEFTQA